jgi:hypothetical protein
VKGIGLPRRKGPTESVRSIRRTDQPDPKFNYELFNGNNFNIRYWSWNYRGCWPSYEQERLLTRGLLHLSWLRHILLLPTRQVDRITRRYSCQLRAERGRSEPALAASLLTDTSQLRPSNVCCPWGTGWRTPDRSPFVHSCLLNTMIAASASYSHDLNKLQLRNISRCRD